ncbi:hypothetical protein ACFL2V_22110 [Pseudomonadota bacterium]
MMKTATTKSESAGNKNAGNRSVGNKNGSQTLGHQMAVNRPQQAVIRNILSSPTIQRQETEAVKKKVLVTGFNDWRNLGTPPNVWKCDENPSCRLLVGSATTSQPSSYSGPLVSALNSSTNVSWEYRTLPTTWGAAQVIPYQNYDAVINMGLGVYDTSDAIQIEQNAYNQRSGTDAAGTSRTAAPIDAANPSTTLSPASSSGVNQRITAMDINTPVKLPLGSTNTFSLTNNELQVSIGCLITGLLVKPPSSRSSDINVMARSMVLPVIRKVLLVLACTGAPPFSMVDLTMG